VRHEEETKETLEIGSTIKEKPGKRQKPAQNSVFQIGTTRQTEKDKQRNSKKDSNHKINGNF
jgi:hypothetical protein